MKKATKTTKFRGPFKSAPIKVTTTTKTHVAIATESNFLAIVLEIALPPLIDPLPMLV